MSALNQSMSHNNPEYQQIHFNHSRNLQTHMFSLTTKEYLLKALKIVRESFISGLLLIDSISSLHATLTTVLFPQFKTASTLLSAFIICLLLELLSFFYKNNKNYTVTHTLAF